MAFDIGRFQKKYKQALEENRTLREQIAGWAASKAADIEAAVLAAVTPLRNQIAELKAELAHRERRVVNADRTRDEAQAKVAELEKTVTEQGESIAAQWKRHRELNQQLAAVQPTIEAVEAKAADALALLKKHEARMSEKHRQELAAIENRKVLAAAVPDRNRR